MSHALLRRATATATVALLALSTLLALSSPASAAPRVEVSPDTGVDPAGQTVTVRGSGYDEFKGIYVAWCVKPPAGQKPTPCGGGEDRDGSSGNAVWVSSNPPMYGLGLAEPYDGNGGFEVEIVVSRYIQAEDGTVDCFVTECAVTTRNDHERGSDRSQDAFASVEFAGQGEAPPTAAPSTPTTPADDPAPRDEPTSGGATAQPVTDRSASSSATAPSPTADAAGTPTPGDQSTGETPSEEAPSEVATRDAVAVQPVDEASAEPEVVAAGAPAGPDPRSRLPIVLASLLVVGTGVAVARIARGTV